MRPTRPLHTVLAALALASVTPCAVLAQGPPPGPPAGQTAGQTAGQPATPSATKTAVTITVPEAGEHMVRPLPSPDAKEPIQLPLASSKDKTFTVQVDAAALGKSPRLAVDNVKTGNTAIFPLPKDGKIELHNTDFAWVRRVEVQVTHEGKPVQVARVTLQPDEKAKPQTKLVDPGARGTAVFEDVHVGKAKLTINYGDNFTQTQDVAVTTDHSGDKIVVPAPVSNKVPTLDAAGGTAAAGAPAVAGSGAAPAPAPASSTPAAPAQGGNPLLGTLSTLLSLAVVGAGIYFLYRWSQTGGLAATLKKAGIETSGPPAPSADGTPWQPNAPAAPVVADPSLCQFCGQRKDPSGACACSVAGGVASGIPAAVGVPSEPRLVGTMGVYSGSIFPVSPNGTPVTLGREPTNTIPLGNDTTVSRRHAAIRSESGGFVVSDEGSSNGVYVNGVRISGAQPLRPGDEVQVGNTRFRFEV
jgi:hypothetical protein